MTFETDLKYAFMNRDSFLDVYRKAEANADFKMTGSGPQYNFDDGDKYNICVEISKLIPSAFRTISQLARYISDIDGSSYDKHYYRLKSWYKAYQAGTYDYTLTEPEVVPFTGFTEPQKVTITHVMNPATCLVLKTNLGDSLKAVCRSAIKNEMSKDELQKLFNASFSEATDEIKVEQHALKLTAFLRENKIDKDVAMQIVSDYN